MSEDAPSEAKEPGWIKLVTEYVPLALFLDAYVRADLMTAIKVIVAATAVAVVIAFVAIRKLPVLPLVVAGSVVIFGGLSVAFDNDAIYKMKPTILNALFAVILVGGLQFDRVFLRQVLGEAMSLTEPGWIALTYRYAGLFGFLAMVNEVVWRTQSEAFWVGFKIVGPMVIIVLFSLAHIPFFQRHSTE